MRSLYLLLALIVTADVFVQEGYCIPIAILRGIRWLN